MMGWYDGGPGWGGWLVMTLLILSFWALVIFGGLAVYRSMRRGDTSRPAGPGDAERLLDERFARGEIDVDEYRQRRELLRSGR
jgi:putative membrane protein